jgi:hypothetical protein
MSVDNFPEVSPQIPEGIYPWIGGLLLLVAIVYAAFTVASSTNAKRRRRDALKN